MQVRLPLSTFLLVGLFSAGPHCAIAAPVLEPAKAVQDGVAPGSVKPAALNDPLLSSNPEAGASDVDSIDLGEAGNLVRMVEQGARQPVTLRLPVQRPERLEKDPAAPAVTAPAATPGRAAAAAAVESMRATTGSGGDLAEPRSDPNPRFVPGGPAGYSGGDRGSGGGGGLSDVATPEQRNLVKQAVAYLRSFFNHPATWIAIIVVACISVVTSVGRSRGK